MCGSAATTGVLAVLESVGSISYGGLGGKHGGERARGYGGRAGQGTGYLQMSMLFADVRGSTTLAERMSDAEISHLLNRFYKAATTVLVKRDALIDNPIGDEVVAMFIPGLVGADHARTTMETAKEILRATGHDGPHGPWIPVGVGVHTGQAHLGAVGSLAGITDIAVLGDNINVAARLASVAGAGQIIVSEETSVLADLEVTGLENRRLELKGKSEPTNAWVIGGDPIV